MVSPMRTALFTLAVLASCGGKSTPPTQPDPDPTAAERIASTGPLTEAEFKALHELRAEAAPPARGEMIDLSGSQAYLSLPDGVAAPMPAIIVIHEWWGLNEHIKHWTDRLAGLGVAALAVDLYGGVVATDRDTALATMQGVKEEEAKRILAAASAFVASDARIAAPKQGVIGWCFGGGWSLQAAIDIPELDAAVIYYGQITSKPEELAPIEAEVLGIFATQDTGIPLDEVAAFETALGEAGVTAKILRFEADHAFANPSGERYDEADAAAAWDEVVAFFDRTLR
jgi:carboxymethylenebutenolidase